MLVIMEHRDLQPLAQLALHVEALRGLDVFQVDAAKGRLESGDRFDQPVGVVFIQFNIEYIDAGELLE
jgi:hypothetical protein